MMDAKLYSIFELCVLASSTFHGAFPSWWPTTAIFFLVLTANSTFFPNDNGIYGNSIFMLSLRIVEKAFALRIALVVATLFHEMGHLIAAAATGSQPICALFSNRNVLGNIDSRAWAYALIPFCPWPMTASYPHVELPVKPSSRVRFVVQLAAPTASIILALASTIFAFLHGSSSSLAGVSAIGAWMVALGGIASDLLNAAAASAGEGCIFRCGNFGMLVICAMDRCGVCSRAY
jgi:hypothetical protein